MKILVAISGGVDSAVAATILKNEGHELVGIHLELGLQNSEVEAARRVANQLEIPFYVLNFRETFEKKVVRYFLDEYAAGRTPNPCVVCNRELKFGRLVARARQLGCERIATGHYILKKGDKIFRGADETKDQTYFLSRVKKANLDGAIFPLGSFEKSDVKNLAKKFGFREQTEKKESRGACFLGNAKVPEFLEKNLPKKFFKPGKIVTTNGRELGEHAGILRYTVGQRRGIDVGGLAEPHFVVRTDLTKNELVVAPDRELFSSELKFKKINWLAEPPQSGEKILAQIRYRSPAVPAKISLQKTVGNLKFDEPIRAITPGQTVSFYRGNHLLGGAEIV